MPKPLKRLNKEVHYTSNWFALCATRRISEVTDSLFKHKFVVDLDKKNYTCNYWDLVGIPCRHAISTIASNKEKPADYFNPCYKREMYKIRYDHVISPINGRQRWPKTDYPNILPPNYKTSPWKAQKVEKEGAR